MAILKPYISVGLLIYFTILCIFAQVMGLNESLTLEIIKESKIDIYRLLYELKRSVFKNS